MINSITPLPQAPSRISRPIHFLNESTIFLDSLINYVAEINNIVPQINSEHVNRFNFGFIKAQPFDNVPHLDNLAVNPTGSGFEYVSGAELVCEQINLLSNNINVVIAWLNTVRSALGVVTDDASQPVLTIVMRQPPKRGQQEQVFNESSDNFVGDSRVLISQVNDYLDYYTTTQQSENFGLITETPAESFDAGLITDTNIIN